MAKPKKSKFTVTIAQLELSAFTYGKGNHTIIDAIRGAGGDKQKGARESFISGYICGRLNHSLPAPSDAMLAKSRAITSGANHDGKAKLKAGQIRRSKVEELLYTAGRVTWHRVLIAAGVKTASKQGGARIVKKASAKTPAATQPITSPKVDNATDVAKQMALFMNVMLRFSDVNRALDCPQMKAARVAIAEFAAKVSTIKPDNDKQHVARHIAPMVVQSATA